MHDDPRRLVRRLDRSVTHDILRYINILTYLLTYLRPVDRRKCCQRSLTVVTYIVTLSVHRCVQHYRREAAR